MKSSKTGSARAAPARKPARSTVTRRRTIPRKRSLKTTAMQPAPEPDPDRTELISVGLFVSGLVEAWKEKRMTADEVMPHLENLLARLHENLTYAAV